MGTDSDTRLDCGGWLPIETLKADGRTVLVGVWVDSSDHGMRWSFWDCIADGGPLGCDGEWGDDPTHWHVAPPPPPLPLDPSLSNKEDNPDV